MEPQWVSVTKPLVGVLEAKLQPKAEDFYITYQSSLLAILHNDRSAEKLVGLLHIQTPVGDASPSSSSPCIRAAFSCDSVALKTSCSVGVGEPCPCLI